MNIELCGAQLKDPATGRLGKCIKPKGHHNITGSRDGWTGRLHEGDFSEVADTATDPSITPEVIQALRTLRFNVNSDETSERVSQAIVILDNAGVFVAVDEATGYDIDPEPEPEPEPVSRCTCPATTLRRGFGHLQACPGDPAEWGDMAYTQRA
jgi:hypothetical protein